MSDQPQEKKIIIDEDWKSQVEAEREAAAQQPQGETAEPQADAEGAMPEDVPLPPATLEVLVGSLATQAMVALGILPNPMTNQPTPMMHQAKHLIDMLAVVQEKTTGNRTDAESALLDDTVHQLRMAFVSLNQGQPGGAEEDKSG